MSSVALDWYAVLERIGQDDRIAFLEAARFLTRVFASWRAYDLRDEWDDLIQETVVAALEAQRAGKLRCREAAAGYLRRIARHKLVDLLRRRRRVCEALDTTQEPDATDGERGSWSHDGVVTEPALLARLRELPEKQRKVLTLVYLEGCTYEEAAERAEIPLGSLKRCLRSGLAALRKALSKPSADCFRKRRVAGSRP